jgi:hypothetical protein
MSRSLRTLAAVAALITSASCGDASDTEAKRGAKVNLSLESGPANPLPGDSLTLRADVVDSSYLAASYDWTVTDPASALVTLTKLNAEGSLISFTITKPGTYKVFCKVTLEGQGGVLTDSLDLHADDPSYLKLTYTARILPPPSTGLPPVDRLVIIGGVDKSQDLHLEQGQQVGLKITNAAGPVPAVVRLLQLAGDPLPRDLYFPSGSGKVQLTGSFHALVIPDAQDEAPMLLPSKVAAKLDANWAITLVPGQLVQGKVVKDDATPMAGAVVTIHTKDNGVQVPSTVATTAADGTFAVRASTGPATVSVVPPTSEGLPVATIKNTALMIAASTSGWVFTFTGAKPVKVSGVITRSDGSTPASGAHVVLTAVGGQTAGTLAVLGTTLKAAGVVRRTLTTDASGALKDPHSGSTQISIPAGKYNVALWPGGSAADQGYAHSIVDLSGASPAPLSLSLSKRVSLSGVVKAPDGSTVQARIMATSASGQFSTTSDTSGAFSVDLDDKTTYSLLVRPLGSDQRLNRHVETNLSIAGPKSMPAITLTRAISVTGRVVSANAGIPGATVRIWCSSGGCPSKAVTDEVQTAADGSFELLVPPSPLATP